MQSEWNKHANDVSFAKMTSKGHLIYRYFFYSLRQILRRFLRRFSETNFLEKAIQFSPRARNLLQKQFRVLFRVSTFATNSFSLWNRQISTFFRFRWKKKIRWKFRRIAVFWRRIRSTNLFCSAAKIRARFTAFRWSIIPSKNWPSRNSRSRRLKPVCCISRRFTRRKTKSRFCAAKRSERTKPEFLTSQKEFWTRFPVFRVCIRQKRSDARQLQEISQPF